MATSNLRYMETPQSSCCRSTYSLCVLVLAIGTSISAAQPDDSADRATAHLARFLEIVFPELREPRLDLVHFAGRGAWPSWTVTFRAARSNAEEQLTVEAYVSGNRLREFRARGEHVHTQALYDLQERWRRQPRPPGRRQVDRDLAGLRARFDSRSRGKLLKGVLPRLQAALGDLRVDSLNFEWIAENTVGQSAHRPVWTLEALSPLRDGVACYRMLFEPVDGRLIALHEVAHGAQFGSWGESCR